jgi:hypothetical protein
MGGYNDGRALRLFDLEHQETTIRDKHLQLTLTSESKTSSLILKILEILIQNQVLRVKFTLKPIGEKTRSIASLHGIKKLGGFVGWLLPCHL